MKLFVLLPRFPYPLEKGDKLRAFYQVRELSLKHEIHLCCLTDCSVEKKSIEEVKKYCASINIIRLNKAAIYSQVFFQLFTGKPFQVGYFFQSKASKIIKKQIEALQPDHIYCQLIRTTEYVKHFYTIPKTLDYMDALSKGMERRMESAKGLRKMVFRSEFRRLLKYEHLIFDYFDEHTIISEQDRQHIYHPEQQKITIIPNGVGEQFFEKPEVEQKFTLVFTGNMMYPPNINGAIYLVKEILPLVQKELPDANVIISGANPHKKVVELSSQNVTVTGWVDDMRKSILSAKIYVAPMEIGSGVQNKLLEAMSLETSCVTSTLANKGLKATPGKELFVANSPQQYADQIIKLIKTPELAMKMAKEGKSFVSRNFSWKASTEKLSDIFTKNHSKENKTQ